MKKRERDREKRRATHSMREHERKKKRKKYELCFQFLMFYVIGTRSYYFVST